MTLLVKGISQMKKLKIDLEEIASHMEDQERYDLDFYLDTETGEIVPLQGEVLRMADEGELRDDLPDWEKEEIPVAREALNPESKRYVRIPEKPSYEGYNLMVKFADNINDVALREKLALALNGKGAFGRFKHVLSKYPEDRENWFKFKQREMNKEIIEWLNSIGIDPIVQKIQNAGPNLFVIDTGKSELIKKIEARQDQLLELVVLAVKQRAMRCKILSTGEPVTFRTAVRNEVEGEILTIQPARVWKYGKTHYISGEIKSSRIDIPALQLTSLALKDEYPWSPKDDYWGEPEDETLPYFQPIIDFGPRLSYEMEQILPFHDPEEMYDPIIEASDFYECGDYEKAYKIMEKLLAADLRCLDAHAHLGNWEFDRSKYWLDKAKKHYAVGIKIGELSLGNDFNGLLPWGRINNRPFLRCLHGYGLCLWRLEKPQEARKVFDRMLWLNPVDNQGIRFLLADIDEGKTWQEIEEP